MGSSIGKRKNILVFIFIGLIMLLGVAYFLYFKGIWFFKDTKVNTNTSYNLSTVPNSSSPCVASQNIEYIYYSGSNPLWEKNNKFGLYIYAEEKDLFEIAQNLVNTNGGNWGYVLIPYSVKDRDRDKWGRVFDQLISKHLIPVIQLWDLDLEHYKKETREAAVFLNSFIWPIRYRYISVYNEPNDDKFWFGEANPKDYAKVLDYTISTFKNLNQDFFLLNGALNISSSGDGDNVDAFKFMELMDKEVPGIFDKLDGWASHPYPQPNFSGSPTDVGRMSIRAYEEELEFLKNNLGVEKYLPIFITETGWAHAEGKDYNSSYLPVEKVATYLKEAYENVWLKDDKVRAVMPFTIKYDPPYDHFSWVNQDKVPYLHYDIVKEMKKVRGEPPTIATGNVNIHNCPQ